MGLHGVGLNVGVAGMGVGRIPSNNVLPCSFGVQELKVSLR